MAALLTDDELVAIAAADDGTWPTAVPTVDVDNDIDVARAILRGRRSLGVRELLSPDRAVDDDSVILARDVLRADPPLIAYLAHDRQVARMAGNGFAAARRSDDSWVTDVTAITGVHNLAVTDGQTVVVLLEALATKVFTEGALAGPNDSALFIVGVGPNAERPVLRVSRGVCTEGSFVLRDRILVFEPVQGTTELSPSIRRLVERVGESHD